MNITDELREFMRGADGYELWCPRHKAELSAIADRIDAEHKAACVENAALRTQLADVTESMGRVEERCAKLRELAHLVAEYTSADQCEGCVAKRACNAGKLDMCWIRKAILEKLRELGVEVYE